MRRRRRPISSINVVPYLDVMLVLLVIFMITAPLFNQGAVELPSVGEDVPLPPNTAVLEIVYHPGGGVRVFQLINHKDNEESARLSMEELMQRLDEEKLLLGAEVPIAVSADAVLPYGKVGELLGELQGREFSKVGLNLKSSGN